MTAGDAETITYTIEVQGARLSEVETPQPPEASGLALLHRIPNTSHRSNLVNGQLSSSMAFSWRFRPVQAGQRAATIGATEVVVRGRTYRTEPIRVAIVPQAQRPTPSQEPATAPPIDPRDLFLRAVPSKTRAYRGEQVVIDYFLYYRPGYRPHGIRLADAWDAEGFWREDLEPDPNHRPAYTDVLDGTLYNRLLVKRVAVFPTRTGQLRVDSLRIHADVSLPTSEDAFGAFFRAFDRGKTVTMASRAVPIQVEPLPSAPPDFRGAVGQYTFSGYATPTDARVGERVRLSLSVSGSGNLATLDAPLISMPEGIEGFSPEASEVMSRSGDQLAGRKQFTYTLVPQRSGAFTLDPVTFTYFDPASASYATLQTEPITLLVTGEVQAGTFPAALGSGEIGVLMTEAAWRATQRNPLYAQPWPYLALGLPLVLIGSLVLVRRRQEALRNDVARGRARQARPASRQHLAHAEALLKQEDHRAFYAELERALLAYLAHKLNAPLHGHTRTSLDALFQQHHFPDDAIATIHALRKRISHAQFAPIRPRHDEMERDLALTNDLIAALDQ